MLVADVQHLKLPEQERLARIAADRAQRGSGVVFTLPERPEQAIEAGRLSRSLVESAAGATLRLPPLAARRSDVPLLARQVLDAGASSTVTISAAATAALLAYDWPGNVQQLRLVVERAARMAASGAIEARHLPILQAVRRDPVPAAWAAASTVDLEKVVCDVERHLISMALQKTAQNQAKAAALLRIPRTTLRDKMAKYGFVPAAGPAGSGI